FWGEPDQKTMKPLTLTRHFLIALAALGLTATANAQLNFTFDTDAQGFNNGAWSPSHQAVQQNLAAGGWTLGSSVPHGFDYASGQQLPMQALASSGLGRVSFDLSVDGSSFTPALAGWFQLHFSGNSDGAAGWTQDAGGGNPVDSWHNADDNATYSWHFDNSF